MLEDIQFRLSHYYIYMYISQILIILAIHLIPKWRLSQMSWVELHENEASRAKRRCLQMLFKVAIRCHASELLCSRV